MNSQLVPQRAEQPHRWLGVRKKAGNGSPMLGNHEPLGPEVVKQGQTLLLELGGANGWHGWHDVSDQNL